MSDAARADLAQTVRLTEIFFSLISQYPLRQSGKDEKTSETGFELLKGCARCFMTDPGGIKSEEGKDYLDAQTDTECGNHRPKP